MDRSHIVVVACPLTEQTRGLLGRDQFARMRQDAILVKVARGGTVVERELIEVLWAGRPAAAALDVFEKEPVPETSPLWDMPNVIATPHTSAAAPSV